MALVKTGLTERKQLPFVRQQLRLQLQLQILRLVRMAQSDEPELHNGISSELNKGVVTVARLSNY